MLSKDVSLEDTMISGVGVVRLDDWAVGSHYKGINCDAQGEGDTEMDQIQSV